MFFPFQYSVNVLPSIPFPRSRGAGRRGLQYVRPWNAIHSPTNGGTVSPLFSGAWINTLNHFLIKKKSGITKRPFLPHLCKICFYCLPPPLVGCLPVSGAVCLAGGESRRLALHAHVVALAQVLHPAGVWAWALLAPLGQRGQLKLDTIPVAQTDTQTSGGTQRRWKQSNFAFFWRELPWRVAAVRNVPLLPGAAVAARGD